MRGEITGSINEAVSHDLALFQAFFKYDFHPLCRRLGVTEFNLIEHYEGNPLESRVYNARICARICELAGKLAESTMPDEIKIMEWGSWGSTNPSASPIRRRALRLSPS